MSFITIAARALTQPGFLVFVHAFYKVYLRYKWLKEKDGKLRAAAIRKRERKIGTDANDITGRFKRSESSTL